MGKVIFIGLLILLLLAPGYSQTYPRDQNIVAGEYFLNTDPGEGNGTPIEAYYGLSTVSVNLNLDIPENTVVYIRFKSSNGTWSAPRAILYKPPVPNRGAYLIAAEYFVNHDPGVGKANPVEVDYAGNIRPFIIDSLKKGDVVYLRVKDSYGRWSAPNMAVYNPVSANRGAMLARGEYFINTDPGVGHGTPIEIDPFGKVVLPEISLVRGDRIYFRFQDSFGRWGPARWFEYQYQDIVAAEYMLQYKNGSTSQIKSMTIQPHEDPGLAFFKALSDEVITDGSNIDTLYIRFKTNDIVGQWHKFSFQEEFLSDILALKDLPTEFKLYTNYPNPFNPSTTIRYDLPIKTKIRVTIYNLLGQKVRTLVEGEQPPGRYTVLWNGKNDAGQPVASGIYICLLKSGHFQQSHRLILLK